MCRNLDKDATASVVSMGQDDKVGTYAMPASHWLSVIEITKILDGARYGKQIGFAVKCLARLDEANKVVAAKSLRKHLKIAGLAETLHASHVSSMPKDELESTLVALKEHQVDFPSSMKAILLHAKCQEISALTAQTGWKDKTLCTQLVEVLRLWRRPSETAGFDPLHPRLFDLEGGAADHAATYVSDV